MRGRGGWRIVATAMVVAAGAASHPVRAADPEPRTQPVIVHVRLTAAQDVSKAAVAGLMAEAEAIWRPAGVNLRWTAPGSDASPADASLRVLVMSRAAAAPPAHTWPVGELIAAQDGVPLALVSSSAARRVVAAVTPPHEPDVLAEHRLGLVLGRAVAHELGHFLLGRSHAPSGLMRAYVDVADFADPRRGGFAVDRAAVERLRASRPALARRLAVLAADPQR